MACEVMLKNAATTVGVAFKFEGFKKGSIAAFQFYILF